MGGSGRVAGGCVGSLELVNPPKHRVPICTDRVTVNYYGTVIHRQIALK